MNQWTAHFGVLILRVLAGLGIASHGYPKVFGGRMDELVEATAKMGFPVPWLFAWAAALSEFAGGLLLAAGLAARISAFVILCTRSVAAFVAHAGDPFSRKELALAYAVVALALFLTGPGRYSLDRLLGREKG
jgi:putative oxidoreductase